MFKWSGHNENRQSCNNQPFFAWKYRHVGAAVLSRAQLCKYVREKKLCQTRIFTNHESWAVRQMFRKLEIISNMYSWLPRRLIGVFNVKPVWRPPDYTVKYTQAVGGGGGGGALTRGLEATSMHADSEKVRVSSSSSPHFILSRVSRAVLRCWPTWDGFIDKP